MFWDKGCDGFKKTTLRRGKREGVPQKRIKAYKGAVGGWGLKLINLERTHFLNGPHQKIVGFFYFSKNPLKKMNVSYFI